MPTFDEQRRKAFDFCADAAKQLIALSTGIVAFMVTFSKDFIGALPEGAKSYAFYGWVAYLAAIVFGILVVLALTAQLQPKDSASTELPSIRGSAATYTFLQIVAFLIAMGLTLTFGVKAMQSKAPDAAPLAALEKRIDDLKSEVLSLKDNFACNDAAQLELRKQLADITSALRERRPDNAVKQKRRHEQRHP